MRGSKHSEKSYLILLRLRKPCFYLSNLGIMLIQSFPKPDFQRQDFCLPHWEIIRNFENYLRKWKYLQTDKRRRGDDTSYDLI